MQIKNFQQTPLKEIVDCLVEAFEGYFVKMPSDVEYWRKRFRGARVDLSLSFGMFDQGRLVGFMMIGVDEVNGKKIAFNTGTGVVEAYRGQQVVDQLYQFAIPIYKKQSVDICALEVIQDNHRAIRVYERCGFKINKSLRCFKGTFQKNDQNIIIEKTTFLEIFDLNSSFQKYYSWDHVNSALSLNEASYQAFFVKENDQVIGYCIINTDNGYLPQFELLNSETIWKKLFTGISTICSTVKINNVDDNRKDLVEALLNSGLENHIDQYEMSLELGVV